MPRELSCPFNVDELEDFRKKLQQQLIVLSESVSNLQENVLQRTRMDSGDLTSIPTHLADISNDAVYHDITLGLMHNEMQVIREIQEALQRIKDKTYGICEQCQRPIARKRLEYVPYTQLCISCKSDQEKKQRRGGYNDGSMW